MQLAILLVLIFLVVLCFFGLSFIVHTTENIEKKVKNITPNIINQKSFQDGISNSSILIKCSLFKMWKDNELLDFDSIDEKIAGNIKILTENPDHLIKVRGELIEYLEEQKLQEPGDSLI